MKILSIILKILAVGALLATLILAIVCPERFRMDERQSAAVETQQSTNQVTAIPAVTNQTDFDAVAPETEAALNKLGFTAKGTSPIGARVVLQK